MCWSPATCRRPSRPSATAAGHRRTPPRDRPCPGRRRPGRAARAAWKTGAAAPRRWPRPNRVWSPCRGALLEASTCCCCAPRLLLLGGVDAVRRWKLGSWGEGWRHPRASGIGKRSNEHLTKSSQSIRLIHSLQCGPGEQHRSTESCLVPLIRRSRCESLASATYY